jgi:hypothetical protein
MVGTFVAAVIIMLAGVAGLGKTAANGTHSGSRSTQLMVLRVGLCVLLLAEIIIYIAYIK